MTTITEQSNLLNPSTQLSFLPEKIISGLCILGSLAGGGFLGFQISKEHTVNETEWVAIGSLTALFGFSVFRLARAFQHGNSPVAELSYVATECDQDSPNLDLIPITQKISKIVSKISNHQSQSSSIQENTTTLDDLSLISQHLVTQKRALKTSEKENLLLQSEKETLVKQLKAAQTSNSSQSLQIENLTIQLQHTEENLEQSNLDILSLQVSLNFYTEEVNHLQQTLDGLREENTESSQGFDEIRSIVANLITSNSRSNSTQPSPYKTFSLPTTPITHHRALTRRTPTCTPTKLTYDKPHKGI